MNFTEVSKVDEIPAGHMKSFVVDGKEILVINYDGNYYAIGGKCTHMGGGMDGWCSGHTVGQSGGYGIGHCGRLLPEADIIGSYAVESIGVAAYAGKHGTCS